MGFKAFFWQRVKDSNPHIQSQSLLCYLYTNPLYLSASANRYYYTDISDIVNRFFKFFSFLQFSRKSIFSVVEVQKGMSLTFVLKSRESVQLDAVNSPENALFDVRVGLFQLP